MIVPQKPDDEAGRMAELYKYELLDTVYEREFDEIVQLASQICQVPISLITLVDMDRQWFKANHGLNATETARNISFCGHAILSDDLFEVSDAIADARFFDNPLVTGDPNIRYYAGIPLRTPNGYNIGTLCVIDRVPRKMDDESIFALKVLTHQIIKLFELRIKNRELKKITDVQQTMMTIMAHDIRGPLATFKGLYDLKSEGLLSDEDVAEIEELAPAQFDHTIQLLNEIVDWGKLQLSAGNTPAELINLHDLCASCFAVLELGAKRKQNTLVNDIETGMQVTAQPQGIAFILRNILGNANKFTANGSITVSASKVDRKVYVTIKDTGVGISEKARQSLLDRKWGVTDTGTNDEKGSGMGLKMIFEYLAGIGGDIQFTSIPGKGTTVVVMWPE